MEKETPGIGRWTDCGFRADACWQCGQKSTKVGATSCNTEESRKCRVLHLAVRFQHSITVLPAKTYGGECMHVSSMLRMRWFAETYLKTMRDGDRKIIKVVDVGSYDVNGSYKYIFDSPAFQYVGLDMEAGPNVDVVPKLAYNWAEVENDNFDAVICGQAFEHIEFPWVTFAEMVRILKPGGFMCIIVPRTQERHRHPVDTYRYDVDGLAAFFKYGNLKIAHLSTNLAPREAPLEWYNNKNSDCMGVAQKPADWKNFLDISQYEYEPLDVDAYSSDFVPIDQHPGVALAIKRHYLEQVKEVNAKLRRTAKTKKE